MNEATSKPPVWFWIVAVLALLWNAAGCAAYWTEVTRSAEWLAEQSAEVQRLYETVPTWVTAAFAISVWGGLLGSIGLLLRKSWAALLFIISLVAVLAQMTHSFLLSDTFEVTGASPVMPILITAIAVFLVWFSSTAKAKRWLT